MTEQQLVPLRDGDPGCRRNVLLAFPCSLKRHSTTWGGGQLPNVTSALVLPEASYPT